MRIIIAGFIVFFFWAQIGFVPAWAAQNKSAAWRTVVIDPGHGGQDNGVVGDSGLREKDLTLTLAKQLAQLLTKRLGVRVVFTRQADNSISLPDRVAIANNNKADLFVSLHANADLVHQVQGLVVYVLTKRSWPAVTPLVPDLPGLVHWDLAQKDYWPASLRLAQAIHAKALNQEQIESRGVFAAPLLLLKGAFMPAVLVEVGFLSHPQEEEDLLNPEYQQVLVNTIFEGILQFKRDEPE